MNAQPEIGPLDTLVFDNSFTRELPADPQTANYRRQVSGACFSRVLPRAVARPRLVAHAREVAALLGLSDRACRTEEFVQVFAGNRVLAGMDPHATCYGGHQFGNWAGQLGDGRAINLGEVVNAHGERWILQLKGAGPTPYSRSADGLAVLRSSLREFLCSEAMHHLGVPTTRALSLITTGEQVVRDMFYDGNARPEPGAVVCRVAQSFTRFGHFQILLARNELDLLRRLVDYSLRTDYPQLGPPSAHTYVRWLEEIGVRTADMIVHWMRVGFVHGVMNTDNMSILGQTIDYGPYGWLEDYDPDWTPNITDAGGRRYRYGNQPRIALWNLVQLANAIYPLIGQAEPLERALASHAQRYEQGWQAMMAAKLGWTAWRSAGDPPLVEELLAVLRLVETDMTIFFRHLARFDVHAESIERLTDTERMAPLLPAYYDAGALTPAHIARIGAWLRAYAARSRADGDDRESRRARMDRVNPKYVLRNYLAQLAIDRCEQGDDRLVHELLEVLRHPYAEQTAKEQYAARRPDWARNRPGCSMLSCSS